MGVLIIVKFVDDTVHFTRHCVKYLNEYDFGIFIVGVGYSVWIKLKEFG